ncbi:hypothetical protein M1L60_44765 [Actinoplanes sp. TRM 88003]|uniref:Uncharacterized protein n=1 Tax=Paractinoplanes aksuensis TaxID=2939490 RepID=A0ABT1E3Z0_9ACTN|nr:hypothetical protein [Actinoplanes aksuensis]MCO8277710.1 hypothetical protein [Actinoplanes aksuensis]
MNHPKPTVVLVLGAFTDASSFARIVPELLDAGIPVLAPPVSLRSLVRDAAAAATATIPGDRSA